MIIVKSKIKELVEGFNVAGDFAEALNEVAINLVENAAARADANGRKTVQDKDVYVGDIETETMLVVKSKIKSIVEGFNVSGTFADGLNELLAFYVSQAALRAEANGRKTIGARDL